MFTGGRIVPDEPSDDKQDCGNLRQDPPYNPAEEKSVPLAYSELFLDHIGPKHSKVSTNCANRNTAALLLQNIPILN